MTTAAGVDLKGIPYEMRAAARWGLWRQEEREGRDGKKEMTKVPYSVVTGKRARSTTLSDWTSFEESAAALVIKRSQYAGLGFALGDGWCGVDLDNCRDAVTGQVHHLAGEIVERLNSYTEISPSGTGVKVFLHGFLPPGRRKVEEVFGHGEHSGIEMYDTGRYFTVTGNTITGDVVCERTDVLAELHRELMPQEPASSIEEKATQVPLSLDDHDLFAKMFGSRNGIEIERLFEGDTSMYGGDDSAADLALCSHLWFWTGDIERADRLFRISGLYRPKWDRQDYRERTLAKASTGPVYTGPRHDRATNGHRHDNAHQDNERRDDRAETPDSDTPSESLDTVLEVFPATNLTDRFWHARPRLKHIRQAAHSANRSADAVLYGVLTRFAGMHDPNRRINTTVGSAASLNFFCAVIGPSGQGKTDTWELARELLPARQGDWLADNMPIGTGEGFAEAYMGQVKETIPGQNKSVMVRKQVRDNAVFFIDEGEALTRLLQRSGATVGESLRRAWKGTPLGQSNGTAERTRIVPRYAMGMVIGFQPSTVQPLLADWQAGTPQRFMFASSVDPTIPDERIPSPGPLTEINYDPEDRQYGEEWSIDQEIIDEIYALDLARAKGLVTVPPLDAHAVLCRVKAAGLLAMLEGRTHINGEDWQLADLMWGTSCAVRAELLAMAEEEQRKKEVASNARAARRELHIGDAKDEHKVSRLVGVVSRHVARHVTPQGCARRCIERHIDSGDKPFNVDDLIDIALAEGRIVRAGNFYKAPNR